MKVCILTAGKGTRMGPVDRNVNKALLPIQNKAIISHIIEFFPPETEFVIGLGHLAKQVQDYLSVAYPDKKFDYVHVDNIDGPGSGSGYSLLCCKEKLQEPFTFVPCDCLLYGDLKSVPTGNWVGTKLVDPELSINYCNFKVNGGIVSEIKDKEKCGEDYLAWSGVLFVNNFKEFWNSLSDNEIIAGEHQISNGLKGLAEGSGLSAVEVNWVDLGDWEKYLEVKNKEQVYDFSKMDEIIYFVNNKVIKFFSDNKIIQARILKSQIKPNVFPKVSGHGEQFLSYPFTPGNTFYLSSNPTRLEKLLDWLDKELWEKIDIDEQEINKLCHKFYYDKTMNRIELFKQKFPNYQFPTKINGKSVPSLEKLIADLPWKKISNGFPSFIHGDLNFDNIIFDEKTEKFTLIDWRQDFAGKIEFGDIYYDLAKLLGGVYLNYDCIKMGLFKIYENQGDVFIDFARRTSVDLYEKIFENFINKKGLDFGKVRLITGISYLNMAPLHHPPYNFLLMAFGTLLITEELDREKLTKDN
jgi:dTDP-glucose pyrophosphorylase